MKYVNSFSRTERNERRKVSGVSLLELLIVITIGAILFSVGIPSYRSVTNSNRIAAEVNGLLGDMQYARAEAIRRGQTVTVCASTDGASCSNATAWQNGWLVFSNPNGDTTVDPGDTVLRVQVAFSGTDTFDASNGVGVVTFNREGFAVGVANGALITLHDATSTSAWTRCLAITRIGVMATQIYNNTTNGFTCL
jgi:type IV fimbrial biogenesis protein FimT